MSNIGEVCLWDANGQDNQLWYWDGPNRDVLRNKQFPDRVSFITMNNSSCKLFQYNNLGTRSWISILMIIKEASGVKFTSQLISTTGGTRDGKWTAKRLSAKALPDKLYLACAWMSLVVNPTMGPKLVSTKGKGALTKGGAFSQCQVQTDSTTKSLSFQF